ncbi:hypothetical protein [Phenylobacterium sp.]|uniref:hypothetical protein n=1 Tax=Phenylobacterium sp. TaxID=1871053 RepID=UPI00391CFFCE
MAVLAQADEVHRVISTAFDPDFYRTVYLDLADPRSDALGHYVRVGWREGRDPVHWFSAAAYLDANEDVRASGVEPFFHFLSRGRREGRDVRPSRLAANYLERVGWTPGRWTVEPFLTAAQRPPRAPGAMLASGRDFAAERALVAAEFDAAYYLAAHPDIAAAGTDPLQHFLVAGWKEGRDPNPRFSIRDYLETYPDIAQAGINPFVHYLMAGRAEGRIARHDLGFRYDLIAGMEPVAARLARAAGASASVQAAPAAELGRAIALTGARLSDLHVTFSHDDPTANYGGMQLCLRRESARFTELGVDHLHIYPAKPWPMVRTADEPGPMGVLLNGRRLGLYSPATVRTALARAAGAVAPGRRSFAIHSLLGHCPDETAKLLRALGLKAGFFWLHDFASLCAGYHLLRDDVEDCAAPPPDSAACGICAYGPFRKRHLDAHRRLFHRLSLTVVAPSETTLNFWRASTGLPVRDAVVLPHAELVDRGPAPARTTRKPLRVAYVGMPVALKGWPIFRALADRFADDRRYEFLHLGGRADPSAPVAFHKAVVSEAEPRAMQAALEALEVDVALIWPLCRETFSFTAYEAAAAGAAVITGPDSGNVAAFVAETGLGLVLDDEVALARAFETGAVRKLARARRAARLHELRYSGMTADLAFRGAAE